ncbi:hypothetical protein FTX61_00775 [Nitriliruptoraceae bacterium ZYF776]|nr:hypothetical protein [Profundirhabdus halotolerans]
MRRAAAGRVPAGAGTAGGVPVGAAVGGVVLAGVAAVVVVTARRVAALRAAGRTVAPLDHATRVPGTDPACRLVVCGDSAAAGHGLPSADDGLARQLGRRIVARTGRAVAVTSVARDGATTAEVTATQVPQLDAEVEVVLVGVGVNDAVRGRAPADVEEATAALLRAVGAASPTAEVVLLSCPDLGSAPGLPRVLRPLLGRSCRRVAAAQHRAAARVGVTVVPAGGDLPASAFGPDGFHPGPAGIRLLVDRIEARTVGRLGIAPDAHR